MLPERSLGLVYFLLIIIELGTGFSPQNSEARGVNVRSALC